MADQKLILADDIISVLCEAADGDSATIAAFLEIVDSVKPVHAVILPFNVGKTLWWVSGKKIMKGIAYQFLISENGLAVMIKNGRTMCGVFPVDQIGKTLFFSLGEAEDAREGEVNG